MSWSKEDRSEAAVAILGSGAHFDSRHVTLGNQAGQRNNDGNHDRKSRPVDEYAGKHLLAVKDATTNSLAIPTI